MPSRSSSDKLHDQVKTATKSGKNGNKGLAKNNIAFKSTDDIDDNGLVDGSEKTAYKLYTPDGGIFITTKSGKTFSDATSKKWSAIAATPTEKGYRVLITNNQSKKGKYRIWKLNSKGIVRSKKRWLRERTLSSKGYEKVFEIDFNGDGMIEADTLIDAGDADFSLKGNATVGKRLRAKRAYDDPDGNGRPLITWQSISSASIWTTADTGKSIRIPATLEGAQVRARVEYKDRDGFEETVYTQSRSIPYVDSGDAAFLIQGTPAVGQTLSIQRSIDDPDGNGDDSLEITWQASLDGVNWSLASTNPSFIIPKTLEGHRIDATVAYTDAQGFEESISTNTLPIPYVDSGDAAFLIQGTPAVGQTLSITQFFTDPDGDGTPSFSWLQSSDGINWSFLSSNPTFAIPDNLEGQNITATVRYTDGQGFEESISTNALSIPYVDSGDAAFLIQGTPAVGQTLSVDRSIDDPDGNGTDTLEITWQASLDGVNWSLASTNHSIIIPKTLEGHRIDANVAYTDAQGFSESIRTDDLTIPFIDDGDAAFTIQGTPDVGQTLSILRSTDDPDGNGDDSLEITWQASLDGINWWEVGTAPLFQIGPELAGHQLNALVRYVDGQGFKETIRSVNASISGAIESNLSRSDDFDSNTNTSGKLDINSSIDGELESAGDRDWFAIDLTAGRRYQVDLDGISLHDPVLYLRNGSSDLIDFNDDKSLFSLNSQIIFDVNSSDTYYLDVGSYDDAHAGRYTLKASELNATNPSFSSTDGYGHVSARRAFEELLDISLDPVASIGGALWGVDNVDAPEVWNGGSIFPGTTGGGTTVAVIDTGVDLDHPEFAGRIVAGYDFVDNDSIADDGDGHGTHVAGIIAGANDGQGITGVAHNTSIMPLRVLDNDGNGWVSDIISAVRWAADNGADVINLSLGGDGSSQAMADAIRYASQRGSVVVMASGNTGRNSPDYPAAHAINHGIAVGAANSDQFLAGFSNRAGSTPLDYVTAPGVNIYSAVPGGGYDTFNGTSMAAPHVAGVAALLKSYNQGLSASTIEDLLTSSGSNSQGRATASNQSPPTGLTINDVITRQTLDTFSDKQLNGTLIASIDGNRQERRSTIRSLKRGIRSNDVTYQGLEDVRVIEASRNSFATLTISNERSVDKHELLSELLATNHFNYFEVDQQFSIV